MLVGLLHGVVLVEVLIGIVVQVGKQVGWQAYKLNTLVMVLGL